MNNGIYSLSLTFPHPVVHIWSAVTDVRAPSAPNKEQLKSILQGVTLFPGTVINKTENQETKRTE